MPFRHAIRFLSNIRQHHYAAIIVYSGSGIERIMAIRLYYYAMPPLEIYLFSSFSREAAADGLRFR